MVAPTRFSTTVGGLVGDTVAVLVHVDDAEDGPPDRAPTVAAPCTPGAHPPPDSEESSRIGGRDVELDVPGLKLKRCLWVLLDDMLFLFNELLPLFTLRL